MRNKEVEEKLRRALRQAPAVTTNNHREDTLFLAREEACRKLTRKRISFLHFLTGQIKFMGWKIWIIQGILLFLTGCMLSRFDWYHVTLQTMIKFAVWLIGSYLYDRSAFSLPVCPLSDAGSGSGNPFLQCQTVTGKDYHHRDRGHHHDRRYFLYHHPKDRDTCRQRRLIFILSIPAGRRRVLVYAWAFAAWTVFYRKLSILHPPGDAVLYRSQAVCLLVSTIFVCGLEYGMRSAVCLLCTAVSLSHQRLRLPGTTGNRIIMHVTV